MITSVRNAQVARARKLLKRAVRDRTRRFLVEGVIGIREALRSGAQLEALFVEAAAEDRLEGVLGPIEGPAPRVFEVSGEVMRSLSAATTPPGAVAIAGFVDVEAGDVLKGGLDLAVVLADVRDPGNAGTMLRTAWSAGAQAVFLGRGTVDVYNSKVVRATAGALFNLPIVREVEVRWLLDELGGRGVKRIAADPRGPVAYDEVDMTGPCAFVFGNEAWGVPEEVERHVDVRASIPMHPSAESLNVAIAAALFLFEAGRQRRRG